MSNTRESWDSYFMRLASDVATRATCPRKSVGAVIVSPNKKISGTGYNGSPTGQPHCTDVGCLMDGGNHCVRVIHAEVNAVLEAQRRGEVEGSTMYVTVFPCVRCLNVMIQAGVRRIVYGELYRSEEQIRVAETAGIEVVQHQPDAGAV